MCESFLPVIFPMTWKQQEVKNALQAVELVLKPDLGAERCSTSRRLLAVGQYRSIRFKVMFSLLLLFVMKFVSEKEPSPVVQSSVLYLK